MNAKAISGAKTNDVRPQKDRGMSDMKSQTITALDQQTTDSPITGLSPLGHDQLGSNGQVGLTQ